MRFARVGVCIAFVLSAAALTKANASSTDCSVTNPVDDANVPNTLRWCAVKVNKGSYSGVSISAGTYELDSPITFDVAAGIGGAGAVLSPSPTFVGDSLLRLTNPCPSCTPESFKLIGLTLDGNGVVGPRGLYSEYRQLVLQNTSIYNFETTQDGGGVFVDHGSLLASNSSVSNNSATAGGGVLAQDADVAMTDCTIDDNIAADAGGGLLLLSAPSSAPSYVLTNVNMSGNEAKFGGAIFAEDGITLDGGTVENNHATQRGGALHGAGAIKDARFLHNDAGLRGGAIDASDTVSVTRSYFEGNIADNGAAIGSAIGVSTNVSRSAFHANAGVGQQSGTVYLRGNSELVNNTFAYNHGGGLAGAVMVEAGDHEIKHCSFIDNQGGGGTIHVEAGAGVTLMSSVLMGPGTECSGAGVFTAFTTTTDDPCHTATLQIAPAPLNSCSLQQDPTLHCEPHPSVRGNATCFAGDDQLGSTRPATMCDRGAVELP